MADNRLQLGAWEADRAFIEHAPLVQRGDVSDLAALHRFSIYVARIVCKCERLKGLDASQPAGFVLVDPKHQVTLREKGLSADSTLDTGLKPFVGRIHFVTEAVTRSVYEVFAGSEDQVIFDRLGSLQLHDLPTLIYLPSSTGSKLLFLPRGSGSDEGRCEIRLNEIAISEDDIVKTVQSVYDAQLKTPDMTQPFPVWEKASAGWPIQEAERGIQAFVRVGLATRFHWCRIAMEQPDKDGRTDIELLDESSGDTGSAVRHAILELKVLRSWGSTGGAYTPATTNQHIDDGVEQAFTYAKERNAIHRLLCCFDMRDSDIGTEGTFAHVKDKAASLAVKLHRWFLYRSSDDYRAAMAAAMLTSTSGVDAAGVSQ